VSSCTARISFISPRPSIIDGPRGRLKLKEISYIHAKLSGRRDETWSDPLIDEKMPVVVLPTRSLPFKNVSNLKEVEARGGKVVVLTDDAKTRAKSLLTGS